MSLAQPKPSKGARLRTKRAAKAKAARAYAEVCRQVDLRDNFACVACGRYANPHRTYESQRGHHHHIQFRSRGGADTTANICLVCQRCHADIHAHKLSIAGNADTGLTILRVT